MNTKLIRFSDGTTIRADCIVAVRPRIYAPFDPPFGLSVEYFVGDEMCEYRVSELTEPQRTQYMDTILQAWSQSLGVPKSDRLDAFVRDAVANTEALNEGV